MILQRLKCRNVAAGITSQDVSNAEACCGRSTDELHLALSSPIGFEGGHRHCAAVLKTAVGHAPCAFEVWCKSRDHQLSQYAAISTGLPSAYAAHNTTGTIGRQSHPAILHFFHLSARGSALPPGKDLIHLEEG